MFASIFSDLWLRWHTHRFITKCSKTKIQPIKKSAEKERYIFLHSIVFYNKTSAVTIQYNIHKDFVCTERPIATGISVNSMQ